MLSKIKKILWLIVEPENKNNEDAARKEFILNVLLSGTLLLSIIAATAQAITFYVYRQQGHGASMFILTVVLAFFLALYVMSKAGKARIAAYIFIAVFFFLSGYTSYQWGVYAPQALLLFALVIVMSGILISTRFAFFVVIVSTSGIFALFEMQDSGIVKPDLYWRETGVDGGDVLVYVVTLFVISIVSWLSNREIEKSLFRARNSEAELKEERDMLEIRVQERTEELRKAQYEKMRQLYRFAEFGRISSGLFHDITNYLTALSLNLEMANERKEEEAGKARNYLERAMHTSSKMEDFIEAIQKQLKHQDTKGDFSLVQEIEQVVQVLDYKARVRGVELSFSHKGDYFLFGNNFKFSQMVTNIVSNAIDSYMNFPEGVEKKVSVGIKKEGASIVVFIKDRGCGIEKGNLEKIFDPFFTTKPNDKGTGIGLSTTKEIVEKDFSGKIEIDSKKDKGTTFKIILPVK